MLGLHVGDTHLRNDFLPRATRCYIPEDGILHSYRHENLKFYYSLFLE
jgi:hypothetical protein